MPNFNIPYEKLSVHLEEVIAIANHIEISKRLKPYLNSMVNWPILDSPKKKLIEDYFSVPNIQDQVLINSLFLSIIAAFELSLIHI